MKSRMLDVSLRSSRSPQAGLFLLKFFSVLASICILVVSISNSAFAQDALAESPEVAKKRDAAVRSGLEFLTKNQADDGTFSRRAGPGLTALAITAALRNGKSVDDPMVSKGLKAMESFVQPDGGIYAGDRLKNYETCIGIMCFVEANKDGRYDKILSDASDYLKGLQYGAGGDKDSSDPWYGGVGYGGPQRPDLSNTAYMVDALIATGADSDSESIQRALDFVLSCQNLKTETNDSTVAAKINDGGFRYVVPQDESEVKEEDIQGGLRSYGSMTYAGLKSMVYAGLSKDDPRVDAAIGWLSKNYSVTEHPGQGDSGLYYYYNTFANALDAAKIDSLEANDGTEHEWRVDLVNELAKRQKENGSWINSNERWLENDPNLCTAFSLLALSYCK